MPEESFSQITPRKIIDAVKNVLPLQRDNVAKSFVGVRVEWMMALRNASRRYDGVTVVIFAIGPSPHCLDLVSGEINAENHPDLLTAAEGDVFVVTGTIKHVAEFVWLNILTVTASVAPQQISTKVDQDHRDSSANPASKTKDDEQVLIGRPWISKRIWGDGMVPLFLVDLFGVFTGHWHEVWVKGFLAVSIGWGSIWFFEFLTKVKKWAMNAAIISAGLVLVSLSSAMFEAYRLADETPQQIASLPHVSPAVPVPSLPQAIPPVTTASVAPVVPPAVTTPLAEVTTYSLTTPEEMMSQLRNATPFQKNRIAKGFIGTPWRGNYSFSPLGKRSQR